MAIKYRIKAVQESEITYVDGKIQTLDELPNILKQVESTLIKEEEAIITIDYIINAITTKEGEKN